MDMKELVEILACPQCKGPVKLVEDDKGLLCGKCGLLYEIRDGIPVMLVEEAKKVGQLA
ncbi:MAG: Trm112 family protein [Desulfobulbaceae bacterium]|nr:MAG: Trm112 family protein [Desulfobulbaceae bacterium]